MCRNKVCHRDDCPCENCEYNVFNITVERKTPQHPYFGNGSDKGYSINGIEDAELHLNTRTEYLINYNDKEHPFYISSDPEGKGKGRLSKDITTPTIISFDRPGTYYYACSKHPYMGGDIFVYS